MKLLAFPVVSHVLFWLSACQVAEVDKYKSEKSGIDQEGNFEVEQPVPKCRRATRADPMIALRYE